MRQLLLQEAIRKLCSRELHDVTLSRTAIKWLIGGDKIGYLFDFLKLSKLDLADCTFITDSEKDRLMQDLDRMVSSITPAQVIYVLGLTDSLISAIQLCKLTGRAYGHSDAEIIRTLMIETHWHLTVNEKPLRDERAMFIGTELKVIYDNAIVKTGGKPLNCLRTQKKLSRH